MNKDAQMMWLSRELTKGRISRREFLGRSAALGVTGALAVSLAGQALAAEPKRGGSLKVGLGHGSTTDSLDPGSWENGFTGKLGYALQNHIAEVDEEGNFVPELAESMEASDDATEWVFKLRKGVEFHNGKTLDADDVVASINHHRGESKSAAAPLLKAIVDVRADGKDSVVVKLSGGNAGFPFVISDYHVSIRPAVDGKIDPQKAIGTGPFSLVEFDPGVKAIFKRNPNYFKGDKPYFDDMEMLTIADTTARTNALTTGAIHAMDKCDLKTLHLLERNPNIKIGEVTGTLHYTFPMRTDMAPFDNNDVRMALKLSLDRDEVLQKILKGHGALGNDHPISTANIYHADELPQRTYDPEKAKWHLKQAGLTELTVDLSAADAAFNGSVDFAVLYKEHAAKSGITINVDRVPNDGYWSDVWMKKPWCACYWSGRPTEDWMFSTAYSDSAEWNDSFWSHERFNKLLLEARAELDEAKRRAMYVEMQTIVRDEGGVLVPFFANYVFGMANNVQHGTMQGNWDMDGEKFMERWWFA